jgi:hypothetical protein
LDHAVAVGLLRETLDAAEGLPPENVEQIRVLIQAGELALALETLCTQADEYDVALSSEQHKVLRALGESMGVDVSYLIDGPQQVLRPGARNGGSHS